jgi:capsular exopolysaccharide synthesis family protein
LNKTVNIPELQGSDLNDDQGGLPINFKRVFARIIEYWYFIVLSLILAFMTAYLINRYSTRIYPVKASIIIKESDENAGAKFLYNNALINPNRNSYNELYIMKSYPLLQEVMESLGFEVSFYREGEIKTTEYYDADFPVTFHILPGGEKPDGHSMYFKANSDSTFSLRFISDNPELQKELSSLTFSDIVKINGFHLRVEARGSLNKITDKTFVVKFNNPLALAKAYSGKLQVNWAQAGSSVVNLEIIGEVAQKEVDFLNKFIERYQFYDIEKKSRVATMAIRFLDEQLLVIGDSLNRFENQVEDFKRKNIITNLADETNRLYQKLQGYETQKFQYGLLQNYFKYITELLKNQQYEGIFTPASVGITDDVIAGLVNALIEEQTQVNLYKSNFDRVEQVEGNPALQSKLKRIELIKNDILKTIENSRQTQRININFINDQIRLVERQLAKLPSSERELVDIRRNYSLKENLYVYLLQKRTEAGLSKASTTSDIVVVNPAMAGTAITPKVEQNYMIAAGAGMLLPLLIFVLLELFNNKVQSKEDIEKITGVPLIGGIGHNPAAEPLVIYMKPRSAMAESFRALRSNLNYFTGNKEHQVFMISSSIPGDGKSFTTLNLACVFALTGKRTLIIGADLRKPKLFDDLKMHNDTGLSQYLSGMAAAEDIIQKTEIGNLYFISGGPMPPNPSELLIRPVMDNLMNDLRQQFDFIIMDTPPLSFVADAFVLSKYADHTLFVIRQDFTPKTALYSLDDYYTTGKLPKVSILFNDLQKSGLGYGYDRYGYGYGYFSSGQREDKSGYYS